MSRLPMLLGVVALLGAVVSAATDAAAAADDAQWYRPGYFDHSTFYLLASSHNDIAYLDDPRGTADYRSENLILPALELMKADPTFCLDVETTLYLREFLDRHPERLDEVRQRVQEHRLSFGGRYTQFYEALFGGEALARQMYFGRKWLRKILGPGCDTHIVWDTDVPQRTLQSPQVFAKAGIKYLMIGRHPTPGIHLWQSPDGSSVLFDTYLYSAGWGSIPGQAGPAPGTPTEKYVGDLLESQRPFFEEHHLPNFGTVTMSDYSCPGHDLIDTVNDYNARAAALQQRTGLAPPRMKLATAETYLSTCDAARPFLPVLKQDRPNPWSYHHQPSHERLVSAAREGYNLLVNAERFALIASLLGPEDRPYPRQTLSDGWEGLIYPDHGWCGEKALETMRVFEARLQRAHDAGRSVYDASLRYIAGRVKRSKTAGPAVVVFNALSWKRTGPVTRAAKFQRGEARQDSLGLIDRQGNSVPCQWTVESNYPDGSVREATACFVAEDVPSIGYRTFYLSKTPSPRPSRAAVTFRGRVLENRYYRLELGDRGIHSLVDKDTSREVFDTGKLEANEVFMLGVGTVPLWPFEYTFYPDNRRTETLEDLGRLGGKMKVELVQAGDVKNTVAMTTDSPHVKLRQEITLWRDLKRVDLSTEIVWDGSRKRELRLAFPMRQPDTAQVSYDVPFGVVEVGRNEMGSPSPREVQNWVDVSSGGSGVTLGVGDTADHDLRDVTTDPLAGPMIQPVLLSTLLDLECPGQSEHPWWTQAGRHEYHFALTTHPGSWRDNWRFGWEFSNPLKPVLIRDTEDADVMMDHYIDGDPPEKHRSVRRAHTYGSLPEDYSFCSISPSNVVLSTLKRCDDDDSVVVRYFDMEGRDTAAEVTFFAPIASAQHTNLIEEEPTPLPGHGKVVLLPCGPYSIETVKLTVPSRQAAEAMKLPILDTFAYEDQDAADAVWKKHPGYRAMTLIAERNHTPGGGQSLASEGDLPFAYMPLPADTNLAIDTWMYDNGDPDAFGGVIAVPSAPTDPSGGLEFGIFPSSKFGGHGGGSQFYTYYTGTGDWARQSSGIPRAEGWHRITFRITPTGGAILFDDKQVATAPAATHVRRLYLGNPWSGNKPLYFDDVSVTALDGG